MKRHLGMLAPSGPEFPTASELLIATECVAPWALGLPRLEEEPTAAMLEGRRLHALAERVANDLFQGVVDEDWIVEADRSIATAIRTMLDEEFNRFASPIKLLVEEGVFWQRGFGYDEAGFVKRQPGERTRGAFSGTVDLAYVRADGVLVVADWKFGAMTARIGERSDEHVQLWFLALALCTALKISAPSGPTVIARVEVRHVGADGRIDVDASDITQDQMDAWADELYELQQRINAGAAAHPRRSQACGKCKSKASCPAWQELRLMLVDNIDAALEGWEPDEPPQTPEQFRVLRHLVEEGDRVIAKWREWRRAWLLLHPEGVKVGLGLVEKAKPVNRRKVVLTPESLAAIRRVAGDKAIVVSEAATIESIRSSARAKAGEGIKSRADKTKAQNEAEAVAFEDLEKLGAVVSAGQSFVIGLYRGDGTEVELVD